MCGAVSSRLLDLDNWNRWSIHLLPILFGIVAAWLCVIRMAPGVALVILDAAIWQLAFRIGAIAMDPPTPQRVLWMCLAGLVGGLGVSLATAMCQRRAPAMSSVGVSALTGTFGSLSFAWWLVFGNYAPIPDWAISTLSFTIWQAAVGVCLWHGFRLGKPQPAM